MRSTQAPIVKDIVLLGGGHSHVAVLRRFGMRPVPGVRLTLVTRDVHTPYSGMLPGFIAGHYGYDDCHIDLRPLAQFAGARLYHDAAEGIDLKNKRVFCTGRPPVSFDVLSIDTGSTPAAADVPGAARHALPVKPVEGFLARWAEAVEKARMAPGDFRVVVVGGGAGGVELALSAQHRLRRARREAGNPEGKLSFDLVTDTPVILPSHNGRTRNKFGRILADRGVRVHTASPAARVEPDRLICAGGEALPFDLLLWVTHAAAPDWIRTSGLATDAGGFVQVDECLQSVSHPGVFAAGDIASMVSSPRPKSGVFAVRQGPPLAENLRRAAQHCPLKPFRPQKQFLSLISTGDRQAVASRGRWSVEGRWVWRVKDWIDRRFMARYSELPDMEEASPAQPAPASADAEALREISALAMRCGGCGAKVGSTVLARVLARLDPVSRDDVLVGLEQPDDAAVVAVPAGQLSVHTVDFFRAMVDDPYVFGAIAANHSLGDIYAMGAEPQSALAIATVPYGLESKVEEQLYQLMMGAMAVLRASGTALVGGHTSEGVELAFGLAVNGLADPQRLLRKHGMRPGDRLILTKPLGTGTLFAADMRRRAKARWVDAAITCMLQSNRQASEILRRHGATACTDVTGFGLLGHLLEMVRASGVEALIELDELPVLDGAPETLAQGIFSSLQPQNVRLRRAIAEPETVSRHPLYPLLFDPQTAGGLLASVPSDLSLACVTDLRTAGYPRAAVIGEIQEATERLEPVIVRVTTSGA
jgi:selenide,water dikinase